MLPLVAMTSCNMHALLWLHILLVSVHVASAQQLYCWLIQHSLGHQIIKEPYPVCDDGLHAVLHQGQADLRSKDGVIKACTAQVLKSQERLNG